MSLSPRTWLTAFALGALALAACQKDEQVELAPETKDSASRAADRAPPTRASDTTAAEASATSAPGTASRPESANDKTSAAEPSEPKRGATTKREAASAHSLEPTGKKLSVSGGLGAGPSSPADDANSSAKPSAAAHASGQASGSETAAVTEKPDKPKPGVLGAGFGVSGRSTATQKEPQKRRRSTQAPTRPGAKRK